MISSCASMSGSSMPPKLRASGDVADSSPVSLCHQTRWLSGSTPPWLRQPKTWKLPMRASTMNWPCSTVLMLTSMPAASQLAAMNSLVSAL